MKIIKTVAVSAKTLTTIAVVVISSNTFAGNPFKPGDIVGRSLDVIGLGFIGHVGIYNGSAIIEVLNEKPVIQINTLDNFKSRSTYWGARGNQYFINPLYIQIFANLQSQCNPSYTLIPLNTVIGRTKRKCIRYNGLGSCVAYENVIINAKFRCDTFVDYIYTNTSNQSLSSWNLIAPAIVYNNVKIERN